MWIIAPLTSSLPVRLSYVPTSRYFVTLLQGGFPSQSDPRQQPLDGKHPPVGAEAGIEVHHLARLWRR